MLTSYRPEEAEKCDCGIDWQRMEIRKVKWFGLYRTHQPYKLRLPYSNYPILSLTLDSVLMMCLRLEGLIIRMLNIKKITKNIISPRGRCWQCGRRLWLDRLNWHLILLPVIIVIVENEILHQECVYGLQSTPLSPPSQLDRITMMWWRQLHHCSDLGVLAGILFPGNWRY